MKLLRTSIEIAMGERHPHKQASWKPFNRGLDLSQNKKEIFTASIISGVSARLSRDNGKLEFLLKCSRHLAIHQAKAWMMLPFQEFLHEPLKLHCREAVSEHNNLENLKFGMFWQEITVFSSYVSHLQFSGFKIDILQFHPFHHITLYRRTDFDRLELAFAWCQHQLEPRDYILAVEVGD